MARSFVKQFRLSTSIVIAAFALVLAFFGAIVFLSVRVVSEIQEQSSKTIIEEVWEGEEQ